MKECEKRSKNQKINVELHKNENVLERKSEKNHEFKPKNELLRRM